jgi:hypothetical protein
MELASMLAEERFTDHPKSVCPSIASLLRGYNDNIDRRRRKDLYRYAAESVGTRRDHALQERRGKVAMAWARPAYESRNWLRRALRRSPDAPRPSDGPDEIAFYVLGSLFRQGTGWFRRRGWWSDEDHRLMLYLVDRLIEMGVDTDSRSALLAKLAENVQAAIEPAETGDERSAVAVAA